MTEPRTDRATTGRRLEIAATTAASGFGAGTGALVWAVQDDPAQGAIAVGVVLVAFVVGRLLLVALSQIDSRDTVASLRRELDEERAARQADRVEFDTRLRDMRNGRAAEERLYIRRLTLVWGKLSDEARAELPPLYELLNGWGRAT